MQLISRQSGCCRRKLRSDPEKTSKSRKHPCGRLNSDVVTYYLTLGKLPNLSSLSFPICEMGKAVVFILRFIVGLNELIEVTVAPASLDLIM